MAQSVLPSFFLYGEPQQFVHPDFIHVEELATRSRPSEWFIRPHVHDDLSHLIVISKGAGRICFESAVTAFRAPQLIIVPARLVHAFEWQPESTGMVATIADPHLAQLQQRYREFAELFGSPRRTALSVVDCRRIAAAMKSLKQELSFPNAGQAAAVEAALMTTMVLAIRAIRLNKNADCIDARHVNLMTRFRQLVDQRYQLREPVESYARALAVSMTTLRQACAPVGMSPSEIRDQRAILEAQRLLAYSHLSIAEIGYSLGIEDPAYFSRFFSRKCGLPPEAWRRKVRGRDPAPGAAASTPNPVATGQNLKLRSTVYMRGGA